jgi:hypothetical protein
MRHTIHHPARRDPNNLLALSWSLAISCTIGVMFDSIVFLTKCAGEKYHHTCDVHLGFITVFGIAAVVMLPVSIIGCWCR